MAALLKMDEEMLRFRDDVDSWIKHVRSEISDLADIPSVVADNCALIDDHTETIDELKEEVRLLKQELQILKLIQLKQVLKEADE